MAFLRSYVERCIQRFYQFFCYTRYHGLIFHTIVTKDHCCLFVVSKQRKGNGLRFIFGTSYACSCGNINSSAGEDEDQAVSLSNKMEVGCFVLQGKLKEMNKTKRKMSILEEAHLMLLLLCQHPFN